MTQKSRRKTVRNFTPDWARDAIWYQIFPERFRRGAPQSDPELADFCEKPVAHWRICPWGMEWYGRAPWEPALGSFYQSVYHRRFGGDLVGVREKFDYLQKLGVNALYLNPVFMAPSLHKYDASCLHHIDPAFGPDREGDLALITRAGETEDPGTWIWTAADRYFIDLLADAHSRGLRVIIDGVFNHVGTQFFAFRDVKANWRNSCYADWFRITQWNMDGTFEYEGWFGHKGLPELARNESSLVEPVESYIFNITRRWMDPNDDGDPSDGVDGWRLDVAFCVPHGFWRSWRRLVKAINPQAYLTGEIVGPADDFVKGNEFDAVMNYMWLYPTLGFFSPCKKPLPAKKLRAALDRLRRRYPEAATAVMQNLLDSHDTGRVLTLLENACPPFEKWDDYFHFARAKDRADLKATQPGKRAKDALRQLVIFQMTYVGAPMIYYGTEVGLWGANDPDNRQPMLWNDVAYSPETRRPDGTACRPAARKPDNSLLSFYRRAIHLRKDHEVLRRGGFRWVETGRERVLGFERFSKEERLLILLNASDAPAKYALAVSARDVWKEGEPVRRGMITIEPRGWRILQIGQ